MDKLLNEKFNSLNKEYFLTNHNETYKLRLSMGEELEDQERLNQVMDRCLSIFDFLLTDKDLWIKLIIWDANSDNLSDLDSCGFRLNDFDEFANLIDSENRDVTSDDLAYILYNKSYSFSKVYPLLKAIASYEIGIEPSANISVHFINFNTSSIKINLYDDRGLELIFNDRFEARKIADAFKEICIHPISF